MTEDQGPPTELRIVDLPKAKDDCAAAAEYVARNIDMMIANQQTLAKIRRASYLALVKEGFTEAQALELCVK